MYRRQTATSSTNNEQTIYERKQVQRTATSSTSNEQTINERKQVQQSPNVPTQTEVRIILMGKTGNGKSSTGNSLLRRTAFRHAMDLNAVTTQCEVKSCTDSSNTVRYTIVDTPGLMDTSASISIRALEIQRSEEICPQPHAFLIVFDATNRMTEEERFTIDMLRIIFGESVFDHTIVVFTHGGMFRSDERFQRFWKGNEHLVRLIERCGKRVTRIENNTSEGAESIIRMIREMSDAGNGPYNYRHLNIHRQVIRNYAARYGGGNGNIHTEVSEMVQMLGQRLNSSIWTPKLCGGLLIGAVVGGVIVGAPAIASSGLGTTVIGGVLTIGGVVARSAFSVVTRLRFW